MVTKNFTPQQYEDERDKAKKFGIFVPQAGQSQEIDFNGFRANFASKIEENGTITTTVEVTKSPWFMTDNLAENLIKEKIDES